MLTLINNYAHGYVMVPVVLACRKAGLFELLKAKGEVGWGELVYELQANPGHLRVAMNLLECLGWVSRTPSDGYILAIQSDIYNDIPQSLQSLLSFSMKQYLNGDDQAATLASWIDLSGQAWHIKNRDLVEMIDGVIFTPLLLALTQLTNLKSIASLSGLWEALDRDGVKVPDRVRHELATFFFSQGWIDARTLASRFTRKGLFIFERTLLLAIVGSYAPMLKNIEDVIFGDCVSIFERDQQGHELHLDRTLNVIGSGHQHKKYFDDLEELIVVLFDTEPLNAQPRYIADMGCGDGTLLKRVHEVVLHRTRRGKRLRQFPLQLIGIDYNEKALEATRATLKDIDHLTIKGDIGDPEKLIHDLKSNGIADPENILHLRSFLDHDRPYIAPEDEIATLANRRISFDSVFVDRKGAEIPAAEVYQSLVEHLRRWAQVVDKHPLIILEVHSLAPKIVSRHLSQCENLHFDAYHRFSHQMLLDANHFLLAAAGAGLFPKHDRIKKYPKTLGFNRITLIQFEKRAFLIRWARLADLPMLERLEQLCWETHLQIPGSVLEKRIEKHPQGQLIMEIDGNVVGVIYSQRIQNAESLLNATIETIDHYHAETGSIVQLLGINIAPDVQHLRLGDQLLEFMLQYCELSNDVTEIVGVTRCKEYSRYSHLTMQEYISLNDGQGLSVDPVLRFHQIHGAEIKQPLAGYRRHDQENDGCGVLIRYDVQRRKRLDTGPIPVAGELGVHSVRNTVSVDEIEAFLRSLIARIIELDETLVSFTRPLMEMGLDSVGLMELSGQIERRFELKLEPTFFFEQNTLAKIVSYLGKQWRSNKPAMAGALTSEDLTDCMAELAKYAVETDLSPKITVPPAPDQVKSDAIAIVGIACRLPGRVNTPQQLWEKLVAKQSLVGAMTDIDWRCPELNGSLPSRMGPQHIAYIDAIDQFDAAFFNIAPSEAELMDPQQRILLELSWQCIEDAGYDAHTLAGSETGVFIGVSGSDYKTLHDKYIHAINPYYAIATSTSVIPNRISYYFDFCGPSVQVDTACSSSLVAVHQAIQSLHAQECEQALVGGINLICEPSNSLAYFQAGMLAEDGRCKTFDADANGYVRGEGAVIYLLKPLEKALADKDHIYATLIGSAVNHGGRAAGLTVPNPQKQSDLLVKAFNKAQITPDMIGYVEAHGTGTSLGDPIEVKGLALAFSQSSKLLPDRSRCAIGSIKTNIGHLEAAAGVAGLLKAILCLQHRAIPANLHFRGLNSNISLAGTPFYIAAEHHPWDLPAGQSSRIAGVSSFGSGGTNAHVLIEEYTGGDREPGPTVQNSYLIILSAKTEAALKKQQANFLAWLKESGADRSLADISATLLFGRAHFEYRSAYVVRSISELIDKLASPVSHTFEGMLRRRPEFNQLKHNALLKKVRKILIDDLMARTEYQDQVYHDDICALSELYLLNADFDWHGLFIGLLTQRVSLPSYPFERERYWLSPSDRQFTLSKYAQPAAGDVPAALDEGDRLFIEADSESHSDSHWLYVTEEWAPVPAGEDIDWRQRLALYAGKNIYVVYSDGADKDAFCSLLEKLWQAADVKSAARIYTLHQSRLVGDFTEPSFTPLPDVVFCLAPPGCKKGDADINLNPVSLLFHLSRGLMRQAWGHDVRLFYLFDQAPAAPCLESEALGGFLHSAMLENDHHLWKLISFTESGLPPTRHQILLQEWLSEYPLPGEVSSATLATHIDSRSCEIRYVNAERLVRTFVKTTFDSSPTISQTAGFRRGGTYLITGGLGPIGSQLCRELASRFQATLVIFSKGLLNEEKEEQIALLRSLGSKVHYFSVDVADAPALGLAYQQVKDRVGDIHGIIHLARFVEDGLIPSKSWESFQRVTRAKVLGTILLDEITANEPLEFFIMFSSIAAYGIRGSSDYAYSNAFQNAFARYRNRLVNMGKRAGNTIAQCWGPWSVDTYMPENRNLRFEAAGWGLIDMREAFAIIDRSSRLSKSVIGMMKVTDRWKIGNLFGLEAPMTDSDLRVSDPWGKLDIQLQSLERQQRKKTVPEVVELLAGYAIEDMPPPLVERVHRLLFAGTEGCSIDPVEESEDCEAPIGTVAICAAPQAKLFTLSESVESVIEKSDIQDILRDTIREVLKLRHDYDDDKTFQHYGLDSISAMQLATRLEKRVALPIRPQWFIEYSTVRMLAEHLTKQMGSHFKSGINS
jgi:3-oxoacyl-(acyl-carrier-protein) synthase/acyl carrier protein/NAD(P)-dependent dehydrogenase (short-subunit alcohol dehydrogenase family)